MVKLKPKVREIPLERAVPRLSYKALRPFLLQVAVTSDEAVKSAPYVVALGDRRMAGGEGDLVYVRPAVSGEETPFSLYRPAKPLRDPKSGAFLGYRLLKVADVELLRGGDPATFRVTRSWAEIESGDLLLPRFELPPRDLELKVPSVALEGRIVDVVTPVVARYGRLDLVLINRGRRDGLEPGHLLKVWSQNFRVRDPVANDWVQLPDEEAGKLVVIEPFERVSYALVLEAKRPLRPFDRFTSK